MIRPVEGLVEAGNGEAEARSSPAAGGKAGCAWDPGRRARGGGRDGRRRAEQDVGGGDREGGAQVAGRWWRVAAAGRDWRRAGSCGRWETEGLDRGRFFGNERGRWVGIRRSRGIR